MIKTRTWIIVTALMLLISLLLALWLWLRPARGSVANIYVDGQLVRSVDLSAITDEETFTVDTGRGVNTVTAVPGKIRVSSSDCPDQICVEDGWLSATPIVCLPHRLVIELADKAPGGPDTVAR